MRNKSTAFPFKGAYCASKHAIEAITDSLRRELYPWGIHVCSIEPGMIKTNIWERSISLLEETISQMPEKAKEYYAPFYEALIEKTRKKIEQRAIPAEVVAEVILKALTDKKPKSRYLVGKDAKFLNIIKLLPDKFLDKCICPRVGMNEAGLPLTPGRNAIKCDCEC